MWPFGSIKASLTDLLLRFFGIFMSSGDIGLAPTVSGGKVRVIQGGVAATGTNQVTAYHDGTDGYFLSSLGNNNLWFTDANNHTWVDSNGSIQGRSSGSTKIQIVPVSANGGLIRLSSDALVLFSSTAGIGALDAGYGRKGIATLSLVGSNTSTASMLSVPDPTTDVAALTQTLHGSNAAGIATSNTTGGNTVVIPGCGTRYLTVTNFASIAGGATVTVTIDGVATILTNSSWNVTSNNQTATNIAAAINANVTIAAGCTATASGARVYLTIAGNVGGVILATSDGTNLAVTTGTNGSLAVQYPGGSLTTQRGTLTHTGTSLVIEDMSGTEVQLKAGANTFKWFAGGGTWSSSSGLSSNGVVLSGTGSGVAYGFRSGDGAGAGFQLTHTFGADVCEVYRTNGTTPAEFQNTARRSRVTTSDITNVTTTLAAITGLSTTLIAGRKYVEGWIRLYVQEATAVDGLKLDLDGGTGTWSSFRATYVVTDTLSAAPLASGQVSAIATDFVVATLTGAAWVDIEFSGVCTASTGAGTFIPRFAKNSDAAGAALTLRVDSSMTLEDCP